MSKKLDYYKKLSKPEKSELATNAGTTATYLSQVFNGHCDPSFKLIKKLVLASNGKISISDFA